MQAQPPTTQTRLAPGQSFHFQARAGTRLIVMRGSIEVREPPVCVGEHVIAPRVSLRDGEQHRILQRGWMAIQAQEQAELLCVAPDVGAGVLVCLRFLQTCTTFFLRRIRPRRPA